MPPSEYERITIASKNSELEPFTLPVPIFFNTICLETTTLPARQYRKRRWQTLPQAMRIQKRWTKRWGFHQVPCMFKTPVGLFAHPSLRPVLNALVEEYSLTTSKDLLGSWSFPGLLSAPKEESYFYDWLDKSAEMIEQSDITLERHGVWGLQYYFSPTLIRPSWKDVLMYTSI